MDATSRFVHGNCPHIMFHIFSSLCVMAGCQCTRRPWNPHVEDGGTSVSLGPWMTCGAEHLPLPPIFLHSRPIGLHVSPCIISSCHSVQFSHVWLFVTPWITACQASLSITSSRSLPKLTSTELVMPSNHLMLCCPLLLLPSIFPNIRVFSNESALHITWPKYWSFSFSISPSNERPGLISFRIDWLDLLAVQEILKSLLQHHSSKASILWCSAFFIAQLSHSYVTTV